MRDCRHMSKSHIKNIQVAYHGPFQGMMFAQNKGAALCIFWLGSWHFVWGHLSTKLTVADILLVNENGCPQGRAIHRDFMNALRQGSFCEHTFAYFVVDYYCNKYISKIVSSRNKTPSLILNLPALLEMKDHLHLRDFSFVYVFLI